MLKKFITRVARGQKGFTLIEMIVVVGIIAVLAAVIVPNIGRFIGSGEDGAKKAEAEAVQTAMNAMMADVAIVTVNERVGPATPTNDWGALPDTGEVLPAGKNAFLFDPAAPAGQYLQNQTTTYFYCWDAQGQLAADVAGNVIVFEDGTGACP
jgi:prepilin-type N-terminal cleavage/methylation domain-containing protein